MIKNDKEQKHTQKKSCLELRYAEKNIYEKNNVRY